MSESRHLPPIERAEAALGERIDGVGRHEMTWVRSTGGEDVLQDAAGTVTLTGHRQADALGMLGRWIAADGVDTSKVSPNFRNTVHGALNHHVGDPGTLDRWVPADGADAPTVSPNFRNTVHGALNHHVGDHETGTWSGKGVVVVAPLNGMVAANGPPTSLNTVDTFWALGPDAGLKVPGATVIRPDTTGALAPSETSRRIGPGRVAYATTFEDGREATLLGKLSDDGRSSFADDVGRRLDGDQATTRRAAYDAIEAPREARSPVAAAAIDAELTELSKHAATRDVIRETGPVRQAGKWAWGDRDITAETQAMAASMGTRMQVHTDSAEDIATRLMTSGQATSVSSLAEASSQTRASAEALVEDPRYAAFAQAKAVDRELANAAAEASGWGLSRLARERLALMVERSVKASPLPGIPALDHYGKVAEGTWAPTAYDPAAPLTPKDRDKAIRGNARINTLIRQALENEADPGLARRLEGAGERTAAFYAAFKASGEAVPIPPPIPRQTPLATLLRGVRPDDSPHTPAGFAPVLPVAGVPSASLASPGAAEKQKWKLPIITPELAAAGRVLSPPAYLELIHNAIDGLSEQRQNDFIRLASGMTPENALIAQNFVPAIAGSYDLAEAWSASWVGEHTANEMVNRSAKMIKAWSAPLAVDRLSELV